MIATNNAQIPQNRVAHCKSCNEQRGNRPKPCYSLHASPLQWRKFPLQMAPASHPDGAGFPPRWRRLRPQTLQWIVALHVLTHYCGLRRSSDCGITHFCPKTRNTTFLPTTHTSVCTVGMRSRADFVYIHQQKGPPEGDPACVCTVGMPPEADFVYIHRRGLREAVRIESNKTIEGREMPDQVGHDGQG